MYRKPWPIIFISLMFFLIPFFNILATYFALPGNYEFSDYIYSLFYIPKNYFALFNMVVPSIVAGIAVFCVKKWSYPVFFICILWITFQMTYDYTPHMSFWEIFFTILAPIAINFFYVSYILLPAVRAAYYDPRLRWWETKPRYLFSTTVNVDFEGKSLSGKMTNVSEGGLFALMDSAIEPNSIIIVKFEVLGTAIELKAKIVYRKPDGISHGLQFMDITKPQKKLIKQIIERLAHDKYEETRPIPVWTEDLNKWFTTLIKTGKGFVPEVPNQGKR